MLARIVNRNEVPNARVALESVREAMVSSAKISSFTHNFYKYPACFPETFPRTVIRSFSEPGDIVLDPFVGGGTSAVESLAFGRPFIGFDINDLALFSSKFKTTLLNNDDFMEINSWLNNLNLPSLKSLNIDYKNDLFTNVPRNVLNFSIKIKNSIKDLKRPRVKTFCTGVLLRTIQLELDREVELLNPNLLDQFLFLIEDYLLKNLKFNSSINELSGSKIKSNINLQKVNLSDTTQFLKIQSKVNREADLVVTSPPYPQKHILYNKWQVQGRTETRFPYWIIDSSEKFSEKHYTMGGRDSNSSLDIYMSSIRNSFTNVNRIMKTNGLVVQVVAFNDLKAQFFRYLDAMKAAGFEEIRKIDGSSFDGRLWRQVPNQRWYNRYKASTNECREVVLFHRKKKSV